MKVPFRERILKRVKNFLLLQIIVFRDSLKPKEKSKGLASIAVIEETSTPDFWKL